MMRNWQFGGIEPPCLQAPRSPRRRCEVLWNVVKLHQSDAGRVVDVLQDGGVWADWQGADNDGFQILRCRAPVAEIIAINPAGRSCAPVS